MRTRSWWVGCTVLVAACNGGDGADGAAGKNGLDALVATSVVEPGDDCVAGGYQVRSGQDLDDDGKLSEEETRSTDYICNGAPGEKGEPGAPGEPGTNGTGNGGAGSGSDGADGAVSLVSVTTLAPGDECSAGGLRLEAGLDTDGSGSLEPSEVTTSRALCNGVPGSASEQGDPGFDSLIVTHPEAKGENCKNGGIRIDVGQDADRSATLSDTETSSTSYVCNGADGATGATGATGPKGADGATGPKGTDGATGPKGTDGTNGTNGSNGISSLVVIADEPPGVHCQFGGSVVTSGLDDGKPAGTAGDGVLDPAEVNAAATTYLCRPELNLEDLLDIAGEAVSLHLEGGLVSADFAIVHDLGTESQVIENNIKGTVFKTPGQNSFTPATLQGRFTGKELDELVFWRQAAELNKANAVANVTLTATDSSTNKAIATWTLNNAWARSLEIQELPSGGDPVVTVELIYEGITRGNTVVPVVTNGVHLVNNAAVDTTCASVSGIGSSSDIITTNIKGIITTRPGPSSVTDPMCARPLDGDFDLNKWRSTVITAGKAPAQVTLTLPDTSVFGFEGAWPRKLSVDTGPDGQLVETALFAIDDYDDN